MVGDPGKNAKKKAGQPLSDIRKTYEEARTAAQSTFRIEGVEDTGAMDEVKINRPGVGPDKRTRQKKPD